MQKEESVKEDPNMLAESKRRSAAAPSMPWCQPQTSKVMPMIRNQGSCIHARW